MALTIEELNLQINDNSRKAGDGLLMLSDALKKVKAAASGKWGLSTLANQLTKLQPAMASITESNIKRLSALGNALKTLSGIQDIKISSTIGTQLKKISESLAALRGTDFSIIQSLATALQPMSTLGTAHMTSFINQLGKLPAVMTGLKAADINGFNQSLRDMAAAMAPLAEHMNTIGNSFSKIPTKVEKADTSLKRYLNTSSTASAKGGGLLSFLDASKLKFAAIVVMTRKAAHFLGGCVETANGYIENMNLFTVSMGKYAETATEYAQTVQDVMGIDMSEWARNQGTFMQIASGFGVVSDKAYLMSKGLTQVSYDLSSFFNIDTATALEKVRAGISGEIEPLRSLGYALDKATLQQIAYDNGITQNIDSMTQAQKSQLRYVAIIQQSTNSIGDMARTITSPANALRLLTSQFTQLKRELGNAILPLLTKVLPYVQAFVRVTTELIRNLALLVGYEMPTFDYSGTASDVGNLAESYDDAAEAAVKLKNATLGFDELNVISPSSDAESNSGTYDLQMDLSAFDYDFLGEISTQVEDISKKIRDFFTPFAPLFEGLRKGFEDVGAAVAKLSGATDFTDWLLDISKWAKAHPDELENLGKAIAYIATGLVSLGAGYSVIKGVKWLAEITGVSNLVGWLKKLLNKSKDVTAAFGEKNKALQQQTKDTVADTEAATELAPAISGLLAPSAALSMFLLSNPFNFNLPTEQFSAEAMSIKNDMSDLEVNIVDFMSNLDSNMDSIVSTNKEYTNLWRENVKLDFSSMADSVDTSFDKIEERNSLMNNKLTSDITYFTSSTKATFGTWTDELKMTFSDMADSVEATWSNMVDSVQAKIASAQKGLSGFTSSAEKTAAQIETQKTAAELAQTGIKAAATAPAVDSRDWITSQNAKSEVKSKISSVSDAVGKTIDKAVQLITSSGKGAMAAFGVPAYASGGYPATGDLFLANENGHPEMVGSIGGKTTVANNDQIVASVSVGVKEANAEQNALLREQNTLLRQLLEKDTSINIDGKTATKVVKKHWNAGGIEIYGGTK